MHIKYLQKTTLLDFPETIASIIFLEGCNFRCAYCYNKALLMIDPDTDISEDHILSELADRKRYIDGVVLTGGEPTLNSDLIEFIRKIKKIGLKVKLDTNGYNPEMIAFALSQNVLDYIAMDIKGPLNKYSLITGISIDPHRIQDSIRLISQATISAEFRTTVWKEAFEPDDFIAMGNLLKPLKKPYFIQNFYNVDQIAIDGFTSFSKKEIDVIRSAVLLQAGIDLQLRGDWF